MFTPVSRVADNRGEQLQKINYLNGTAVIEKQRLLLIKMDLINKSETIKTHSPSVSVKKAYTQPLLVRLNTHEIQGGSTSVVAENTAGSGGWIADGS